MRPISLSELSDVAGGELQQRFEPPRPGNDAGFHVDFVRQRDGSTDIHLKDRSGKLVWSQNSGVGLGCFMVGAGAGTIAGGLTGNPLLGGAAGVATRQGCNALGQSSRSRH